MTKQTKGDQPGMRHDAETQHSKKSQVEGHEEKEVEGHHRLAEHRQQHDEAEKNSEKNREKLLSEDEGKSQDA